MDRLLAASHLQSTWCKGYSRVEREGTCLYGPVYVLLEHKRHPVTRNATPCLLDSPVPPFTGTAAAADC